MLSLSSCLENLYPPLIITGEVTNIDKDGAVFHSKITDLGNDGIIQFGFVWDTIHNPTIEKSEKYIFHTPAEVASYEANISAGLQSNKTFYVRAFIQNTKVTTYGEETSFTSLGGKLPEITYLSTVLGNVNDTLVIAGKNLSTRSIIVKINRITAEIIKSNQDSIYIIIPPTLTQKTSAITITKLNQIISAKDSFTLISPIVSSIGSNLGTYGDIVTISGKHFQENKSTVKVYFDNILAPFQIINDQTITSIVPSELNKVNCKISVVMNNQKTESIDTYSLLPVEITDFSPKISLTGGLITIKGSHFSPIVSNNKVYIGGVLAKSLSVSKNALTVSLSLQDTAVYESRNAIVKVDVGGNINTSNVKLLINDKWFRRANTPSGFATEQKLCSTCNLFFDNYYANCFVIGKTAYIGLNNKKDFWAYDTDKDKWRKLNDFPGMNRLFGSGFVYADKIYFGCGLSGYYSGNQSTLNDWWEYNTKTDSWIQKKNFPIATHSSIGFSNDDGYFMSNGYTYTYNKSPEYFTFFLNAWKYNQANDSWNNETIGSWIDYESIGMNFWIPCKSFGNQIFANLGVAEVYKYTDRMYIIDTKTNTMKSIADYPLNVNKSLISLYINGKVYIRKNAMGELDLQEFNYYDPVSNTWKFTKIDVYSPLRFGIAFEVGNIGFVGLGESNQIYEFDPNR